MTRLRPTTLSSMNAVRYTDRLLSTIATQPTLAPAVAQPKTPIELAVHMVEGAEGEDQDYQSDASSSTVSLFSQPARPLSLYSDLKPTSTSKTRRGRHSSAIDQELDTYRKRPSSDSETDDSPTGMYIPVVIHDKARGFRRRTK